MKPIRLLRRAHLIASQIAAAIVEADDTTLSTAIVNAAAIHGAASVTEADDTTSSAVVTPDHAAAAIVEANDTTISAITIAGTHAAASIHEANDTMVSAATVSGFVHITDQNISHTVGDPADALATYTIGNNRAVRNHAGAVLEQWLDFPESVANYEVMAHKVSGTTPTGPAMDTWQSTSVSRSWSLSQTTIGSKTCVLTITIRRVSDSVDLDSADITILADVS